MMDYHRLAFFFSRLSFHLTIEKARVEEKGNESGDARNAAAERSPPPSLAVQLSQTRAKNIFFLSTTLDCTTGTTDASPQVNEQRKSHRMTALCEPHPRGCHVLPTPHPSLPFFPPHVASCSYRFWETFSFGRNGKLPAIPQPGILHVD